jgi:hypothetical protein
VCALQREPEGAQLRASPEGPSPPARSGRSCVGASSGRSWGGVGARMRGGVGRGKAHEAGLRGWAARLCCTGALGWGRLRRAGWHAREAWAGGLARQRHTGGLRSGLRTRWHADVSQQPHHNALLPRPRGLKAGRLRTWLRSVAKKEATSAAEGGAAAAPPPPPAASPAEPPPPPAAEGDAKGCGTKAAGSRSSSASICGRERRWRRMACSSRQLGKEQAEEGGGGGNEATTACAKRIPQQAARAATATARARFAVHYTTAALCCRAARQRRQEKALPAQAPPVPLPSTSEAMARHTSVRAASRAPGRPALAART